MLPAPTSLTAATIDAARRRIERAARAAIPAVADFCLVHLACGRLLCCVTGAHATREGRRAIRELIAIHRVRRDDRDSTVAQVVRTHRPVLRREIHPEISDRYKSGSVADIHRRLAPTSALVVPIVRQGAVLGALSLCHAESGRSYSPRHVAPAERLASAIADTLVHSAPVDATLGLRSAARHAGQGPAVRRRVAARN